MGLFGGGSKKSTSTIKRPGYVNNLINSLVPQINNADVGTYTNLNFADLNDQQKAALQKMYNNPQLNEAANQLVSSGTEGLNTLDNAYQQIQNLYSNGDITPDQINALASQLYSDEDVQNAINAQNAIAERNFSTSTMPQVAQQTMQQSGFGSSRRLAGDLAMENLTQNEAQNANDIASQAYNAALSQAQSIASGNQQNRISNVNALTSGALSQAGNLAQGANLSQSLLNGGVNAAQQTYQNKQNQLNNDYMNNTYAQSWNKQQIQNLLGAANVLNGAQGTTTTTTTSGGGGGMLGGAMSGAAAGSAFGPWGALAGAALGAATAA